MATVSASFADGGTATSVVSVAGGGTDPDNTNNSASEDTTVARKAGLSITKRVNPDPIVAGEEMSYSIAVTNNGPSDASGVEVIDTFPAGLTYERDAGDCSVSGQVVTCSSGDIAVNDTEGVLIYATASVRLVDGSTVTNAAMWSPLTLQMTTQQYGWPDNCGFRHTLQ